MNTSAHIFVRLGTVADLETIISFSMAMAWETERRLLDHHRLRQGILAVLNNPEHGFFLVAECANGIPGHIIGQLMITYEWSDWRNGVFWWVQSVYVDPSWRRQGVYRLLHQSIIQQAQNSEKVCGVRLYVEHRNRAAQSVYRQVGMSPSGYVVFEQDFVLARPATLTQDS